MRRVRDNEYGVLDTAPDAGGGRVGKRAWYQSAVADDVPTTPGKVSTTSRLFAYRKAHSGKAGETVGAAEALVERARSRTGEPLPAAEAERFGAGLGVDVSGVRIHRDGDAADAARAVSARAFTIGQAVFFSEGHFHPGTAEGDRLLAHELAHTGQQAGGSRSMQAELEVSQPGDPWEREADHAADAFLRGAPAPALSPAPSAGALSRYAGITPTAPSDTTNDLNFGNRPGDVTAEEYVRRNSAALLESVGQHLANVDIPMLAPFLTWRSTSQPFLVAMWKSFAIVAAADIWKSLAAAVAPDRLDWAVNSGRDAATPVQTQSGAGSSVDYGYLGTPQWNNMVGRKIQERLLVRVLESLDRVLPRWVKVKNQLALAAQAEGNQAFDAREPGPQEVVAGASSHARLDEAVVVGLAGQLSADLGAFRTAFPEENKQHELAPPRPHPDLTAPIDDAVAIDQASGLQPTGKDHAAVIDAFAQVYQRLSTLLGMAIGGPGAGGGVRRGVGNSDDVSHTMQRTKARADRLKTTNDPGEVVLWDAQVSEQLQLVNAAIAGVQMAGAQADAFGSFPRAMELAIELGAEYWQVAVMSDAAESARVQLDHANRRSLVYPVDLMDMLLSDLRALVHSTRGNKTAENPAQTPNVYYDDDRLARVEQELREQLNAARTIILTHPENAEQTLKPLLDRLADFQAEMTIVANLDACNQAWRALYDSLSFMGEVRALWPGDHGNEILSNDMSAVLEMRREWDDVYTLWQTGKKDDARKALQDEARMRRWKALLDRIRSHIDDQATLDKWMTFGAMVGIALITGGIGAYVEVAAGAAWGSVAGFVLGTAVEATTFTAMSYAMLTKDPSVGGFFGQLRTNALTFGGLKLIGKIVKAGLGAELAATADGKMIEIGAQFAALNGLALFEANQDKVKRTGRGLNEDEVLSISFENLLFVVAISIGAKLTEPWTKSLVAKGELAGSLRAVETKSKQLGDLAKQIEANKGKADKALGKQLLERQAELIKAEEEALQKLERIAADPKKAKAAGLTQEQIDTINEHRGDLEAARVKMAEARLLAGFESAGPDAYTCGPGGVEAARRFYEANGGTVTDRVADPISGAPSADIRTAAGDTYRLTERTTTQRGTVSAAPDPAGAAHETAGPVGGELARPPEVTGGPSQADLDAAHQYAMEARQRTAVRDTTLRQLLLAAVRDGHVPQKFSRILGGGGLAAAMDANTLPGANRGGAPPELTALPDRLGVAGGPEPWGTRSNAQNPRGIPAGQPGRELNSRAWARQPGEFGADQGGYLPAMALADAIAVTRYESGLATLQGGIKSVEISVDPNADPSWHIKDAKVRVTVDVGGVEVKLYADATDIVTGPGEARPIDLAQVNADPAKAVEYKQTLEASGRVIYGDGPLGNQRGGRVLVSGGGATAGWNAKIASQMGGRVEWIGRDSGGPPRTEIAQEEYARNQARLDEGNLSPEDARRLTARQVELRAFGDAMLQRNMGRAGAFSDRHVERHVDQIKSLTPSENIPGKRPGKVWVEFQSGRPPEEFDQVIISHGPDINTPATQPDGTPMLPGAGTLLKGIEMVPQIKDGKVVALISAEPPGAVRVMGAAMWSPVWIDAVKDPAMRATYEAALRTQALSLPPSSRGIAPSIAHAGETIPEANELLPDPGRPTGPPPAPPAEPPAIRYDPSRLSEAQLRLDQDATPRSSETQEHAAERARRAGLELEFRQHRRVYDVLGDSPRRIDVAADEAAHAAEGAHGMRNHAASIPLDMPRDPTGARMPVPTGVQSIEGRLFGDTGWPNAGNASLKWSSDAVMNRTINDYVRANWEQIRTDLALTGEHAGNFDAGNRVGEGYINERMGQPGARANPQPRYVETSRVQVVIRLNGTRYYVYTAYPDYLGPGHG